MTTIVAIGGGDLAALETLVIDQEIVQRVGATRPHALFIPTASDDAEPYWQAFQAVYGQLGCTTSVLRLITDLPPPERIAELIHSAQLIYVGGGNTLRMMRRWRRLGIDRLLGAAYHRGTVLAGLSAGAVCWFQHAHSDSMSFYHPERWDYIRVRCLGFLPGTCCPHYDGEHREESFHRMIGRAGDVGIALDNGCALEVVDTSFRILTSRAEAGAYRVTRHRGRVMQDRIPQREDFTALDTLFAE